MATDSAPELLTLHAVRILGAADGRTIARRFPVPAAEADELLLDFEANGWVRRTSFADLSTWSLTDRGRVENQRQLAAELDAAGARPGVESAHDIFAELNERFLVAITDWQTRPLPGEPLAVNDHTDFRWDGQVLERLDGLRRRLRVVQDQLTASLQRFDGYAGRFSTALDRAMRGSATWVDALGVDSCHVVWFQLHEDLLATLGLERG